MNKYAPDKCGKFPPHVPIQVRAAHIYNREISDFNLLHKYDTIIDGDKVKYCYLKTPNIIGSNVVAIKNSLPPELKLDSFMDYDTMFNRSFYTPMQRVFDSIGWNVNETPSLEDDIIF